MASQFVLQSKVALSNEDGAPATDYVVALGLNRPQTANALSGEFFTELTATLQDLEKTAPHCRAIIIYGIGKHFSAGADLDWMRAAAVAGPEENRRESEKILTLFETLHSLPMPTICVVHGAIYGGAVGLAAAADFCIGVDSSRFCLSEVRVGLIPAVIYPYLARKIRAGDLNRFALSGRVFDAAEALSAGLIQLTSSDAELANTLANELDQILAAAPLAQTALKQLSRETYADSLQQHPRTVNAIVAARSSQAGRDGIAAFFSKKPQPWQRKVQRPLQFLAKI